VTGSRLFIMKLHLIIFLKPFPFEAKGEIKVL